MGTLRYLDLILADGTPTKNLTNLATAEGPERQRLLKELLRSSYRFIFEEIDLQNATTAQIAERFIQAGASGDTVRKCVTFFLAAAKDAALPVSPFVRAARGTRGLNLRRRRERTTLAAHDEDAAAVEPNNAHGGRNGSVTWPQLLLSKFPNFDPTWPDEVKTKWFDAFEKLLKARRKN